MSGRLSVIFTLAGFDLAALATALSGALDFGPIGFREDLRADAERVFDCFLRAKALSPIKVDLTCLNRHRRVSNA
jgi:hypothetical protein